MSGKLFKFFISDFLFEIPYASYHVPFKTSLVFTVTKSPKDVNKALSFATSEIKLTSCTCSIVALLSQPPLPQNSLHKEQYSVYLFCLKVVSFSCQERVEIGYKQNLVTFPINLTINELLLSQKRIRIHSELGRAQLDTAHTQRIYNDMQLKRAGCCCRTRLTSTKLDIRA